MDLASLEWEYEKTHNFRRLGAVIAALFFGFAAFLFLPQRLQRNPLPLRRTFNTRCELRRRHVFIVYERALQLPQFPLRRYVALPHELRAGGRRSCLPAFRWR